MLSADMRLQVWRSALEQAHAAGAEAVLLLEASRCIPRRRRKFHRHLQAVLGPNIRTILYTEHDLEVFYGREVYANMQNISSNPLSYVLHEPSIVYAAASTTSAITSQKERELDGDGHNNDSVTNSTMNPVSRAISPGSRWIVMEDDALFLGDVGRFVDYVRTSSWDLATVINPGGGQDPRWALHETAHRPVRYSLFVTIHKHTISVFNSIGTGRGDGAAIAHRQCYEYWIGKLELKHSLP